MIEQADKFEHVIYADTTYETIIELSQQLSQLMPKLNKVFYASEGSSAVEIALKMSIHIREIQAETKRTHFIALKNSYHGETLGALSVSDVGLYKAPYHSKLFETTIIEAMPYVSSREDPLWQDAKIYWGKVEPPFRKISSDHYRLHY